MATNAFEGTAHGTRINTILRAPEAIDRMEAFSADGRPALLAIADRIAEVAPSLSDTEKQHVGRTVRRVLASRGWRPVEKKRLPRGGLFTTASVYARVDAPDKNEPSSLAPDEALRRRNAAERLEAARAILRQYPVKPRQVESFIREKRREAKRELAEYDGRP